MRFRPTLPPREFEVGHDAKITIRDCAHVDLDPDEQVTFTTPSGGQYDVARKSWGFYATPSLNGRLRRFGLHGVLVRNRLGQLFVLLVEHGKRAEFDDYVRGERLELVAWLDEPRALERLGPGPAE